MKTFTHPQNKWVMTGALILALGFTVSFNKSAQYSGSMDFSSTEKPADKPADESLIKGKTSKIYLSGGVVPVKYLEEDNKVLAIIPAKITNGKACLDGCGYKTVTVVDAKNLDNIDNLNVAVMAMIEKDAKKSESSDAKESDKKEESKKDESKAVDHFARIEKDCKAPKKDADSEERSEHLECMTKAFLEIINDDKKKKDLSSSDVNRFFKKEIQPLFVRQVKSARDMNARYAKMYGTREGFSHRDDAGKSAESLLNDVYTQMGELVSEIPSKYESLRESVLQDQKQILTYEAKVTKESLNRALDTRATPQEAYSAAFEHEYRLRQLDYMSASFGEVGSSALYNASATDNISLNLQEGYNNFINKTLMDLKMQYLSNSTPGQSTIDIAARVAGQRGTLPTNTTVSAPGSRGSQPVMVQIPLNQLTPAQQQQLLQQRGLRP